MAALVPAVAATLLTPATAGSAAARRGHRGYTTVPAHYRANPRFVLSYQGAGRYHTVYSATPPNDGGPPDRNFVDDSSTQTWTLRFARALATPVCGGSPDPCASVTGVDGARGPSRVTSRIDHRHVDGLYKNQNQTVRCRIASATGARRLVTASVAVRYLPAQKAFAVTTSNPVATPLLELRPSCPNEGDPIERILNNYAIPGWSFDQAYGSERWFTSRSVKIPAAVFHRSAAIAVPLGVTQAGTPPRNCSVEHPSYERCSTGGTWRGVLRLRARLAPAAL